MLLHVDFEISALVTTTAGDDDPIRGKHGRIAKQV